MNPSQYVVFITLCILLLIGIVSPVAAQENAPVPVAYAETDAGVKLYAVSADKILETVGTLPDDFNTDGHDKKWMIRHSFVVSPDEQQLAFTAQKSGDNEAYVGLFIYSLVTHTIRQVIDEIYVGYFFHLKWSPDSQNLLIEPEVEDNCGCMGRPEVRVYNLVSDTLIQLTDQSRNVYGRVFTWAENNRDLVYAGNGVNIVEFGLGGIHRQPLVNFEINPPPDSFSGSCNFAWSEQRARWYYVVGCLWLIDDPLDSLYSVDLSGHARLEANIPDLLRQEFPLPPGNNPYVEDVSVTSIHATADTVYAALSFKATVATGSSDTDSDVEDKAFWRVMSIDAQGQIETAFEFTEWNIFTSSLIQAAFAPDNQKVVLVDREHIVVGDLATGKQLVSLTRTLENWYQRMDVLWINAHELLYLADDDVWLLDTSDGTTVNLTTDIEAVAFLLPQTNSY
ncbi:MAG: hypothetical protein ABI690_00700 [Chloroflexota bacterium]